MIWNISKYYVRIALATIDVQSILQVPATDEMNMEDQTALNYAKHFGIYNTQNSQQT